ncbi:MAG TPA: methane monooxygenase/ammonia monooxygenase subunit B [Actinomycetota bacterium]|jgi:methane/ammonia monooxygenase subunit B|nr:methane monooxygenase/ammonia monooxygenase subunit B [Actinomycetota bacterium]
MTMRRRVHRILWAVLAAGAVLVASAPAASAHGEAAQEAFLRMRTVSWIDTTFSATTVKQGETFTISGTVKLLDAWPTNLAKGNPNTGYIGLIAPGPVVLLKERTINGVSAPSRIDVQKGKIYEYSMTVAGRRPGKWHVHPSFSVKGAGTLLGPGQWITVEENPDGFDNPVTLVSGGSINLENYQLPFTWIWLVLTFLIGLAWMIYWTVPKRTVTNLAVTSQIPLNTDGMDYGLITKKDHRNMNWFALGTALLLLAGWIYQTAAFPDKMPQQIFQFAPPDPAIASAPVFAEVGLGEAEYDSATQTLTVTTQVTNTGDTPMNLTQFTTTTLKFATGTTEGPGMMTVSPSPTIAPGAPTQVTMTMKDPAWETERLVPIGESSLLITGVLVFEAGGEKNYTELEANLKPRFE